MITDLFQDIFGYMMIPAFIASYILRAMSIHTIAQRRQTDRVWFAWVPILNQFLLGKVSDQYSLTVKGKRTHQRWWLLGLAAVSNTLSFVSNVMMATVVGEAILGGSSLGILWFGVHYEEIMEKLMSAFLLILLAGAVAAVPMRIVRYVALYRVYESCRPRAKEVLTIVNVLLPVAEPVLLFLCRKDDLGFTRPVQTFTTGPEVPPHGRPGNPGDYAEPWQ